jgi:predicted nucleic acid-binding protein
MSAERYTFDTNVLFYALDADSGAKHRTSSSMLAKADPENAVVLLQTLAELCNAVRKKRPGLAAIADRFVLGNAVLFEAVHALPSDLGEAQRANQQHGIPFWDAMLWAAARRAGCTLVFSEDFQDSQVLGGVTFRNPFKMSASELAGLMN